MSEGSAEGSEFMDRLVKIKNPFQRIFEFFRSMPIMLTQISSADRTSMLTDVD